MKTNIQSFKTTFTILLMALLAAPGVLRAGDPLPVAADPPEEFFAANVVRLDHETAGKVGALNAVAVGNTYVATPVRTYSGYLKVILWKIMSNGSIIRQGDKTAYQIGTEIASTYLGNGRLVTAVRDTDGKLKLSVFQTLADGNVYLKGTAVAESITKVAISQVSDSEFITSIRETSGHLKVTGWSVDNQGMITRLNTYTGGKIYTLDQTYIGAHRVVTAVKTYSGNLKLINFWLKYDGTIHRLGDSGSQAGAIKSVRIGRSYNNRMITAVKQPDNTMKMIAWRTMPDGSLDREESSSPSDPIYNLSMAVGAANNTVADIYTGVKNHFGALEVNIWKNYNSGTPKIVEVGNNKTQSISLVETAYVPASDICVTVVRMPTGELEVSTWKVYFIE